MAKDGAGLILQVDVVSTNPASVVCGALKRLKPIIYVKNQPNKPHQKAHDANIPHLKT